MRLATQPLRRGARGRGGGAPGRALRTPAAGAAGDGRRLLDPRPAPLFGLRAARAAALARRSARASRLAPRGGGDHRLRQPDRRRAGAGAATAGVPGRGPAAGGPTPASRAATPSRRCAATARPRRRCRWCSTPATSSRTRASSCWSTRWPGVPGAQLLLMGGEPDEIAAPARARRRARLRRALRVRRQATAVRAAAVPGAGGRARLAARQGREHALQGLHLSRLGQAARGHAHRHPHAVARRRDRLPGRAGRGGVRRRSAPGARGAGTRRRAAPTRATR